MLTKPRRDVRESDRVVVETSSRAWSRFYGRGAGAADYTRRTLNSSGDEGEAESSGTTRRAEPLERSNEEIFLDIMKAFSQDIDKPWSENIRDFLEELQSALSEAVAREEGREEGRRQEEQRQKEDRDRREYDDLMHGREGDRGNMREIDARDPLDHQDATTIDA